MTFVYLSLFFKLEKDLTINLQPFTTKVTVQARLISYFKEFSVKSVKNS